jgi:hypothetical protein
MLFRARKAALPAPLREYPASPSSLLWKRLFFATDDDDVDDDDDEAEDDAVA